MGTFMMILWYVVYYSLSLMGLAPNIPDSERSKFFNAVHSEASSWDSDGARIISSRTVGKCVELTTCATCICNLNVAPTPGQAETLDILPELSVLSSSGYYRCTITRSTSPQNVPVVVGISDCQPSDIVGALRLLDLCSVSTQLEVTKTCLLS